MQLFLILCLVVVAKLEPKSSFKNYKLYEVIPSTHEQVEFLKDMDKKYKDIDIWKHPGHVNKTVHMLVPPEQDKIFRHLMNSNFIEFNITVENIESSLVNEIMNIHNNNINWRKYQTYETIENWFQYLTKTFPNNIKPFCIGKSHENRKIIGVKLTFSKGKPGVFLEGGMHANQWISPSTVTYILNEFLTTKDQNVSSLAKKYDWYFAPIINPDGYRYSHKFDRYWSKTRSKHWLGMCKGVNPDRNFGIKWNGMGTSAFACSRVYPGNTPFSEIETRSLARFLKAVAHKLFAYISFQNYGQHLVIPYGHYNEFDDIENYWDVLEIANKAIRKLYIRYKTKYNTGSAYEITGGESGTAIDWVKAVLRLPVVLKYIMRPHSSGYQLPSKEIIPNGEEIVDSLVGLFSEAERLGYPKKNQN